MKLLQAQDVCKASSQHLPLAQCYSAPFTMPSAVENMALLFGGAVAGTALSSAFVATAPAVEKTSLRGYSRASQSKSQSSMGAMAGVGAVAGLVAAGAVGKRAGANRTSMQAVGVGINGFGRIGRQVARIAMKDPEVELKLINASYDSDYLAYMMKYDTSLGSLSWVVIAVALMERVGADLPADVGFADFCKSVLASQDSWQVRWNRGG